MIINSDNEKILDYLLERKNIQKEKEKDSIINKQQKDLISLSKEFIRLSKENSELRMVISLKHEVEIKLKDEEFSLKKLEKKKKIERQENTKKKKIQKASLSNDSKPINNNIINQNQTIKKENQVLMKKTQNNSNENNNIINTIILQFEGTPKNRSPILVPVEVSFHPGIIFFPHRYKFLSTPV